MPDEEVHWKKTTTKNGVHVDLKVLVDKEEKQTHQLCCICFEYIPVEDLYKDEQGQKWDVCQKCNLMEQIRAAEAATKGNEDDRRDAGAS